MPPPVAVIVVLKPAQTFGFPVIETTGKELFAKTRSSEAEQPPFVTVQTRLMEVPALSPVMVEVGLLGVVIVAPLVTPAIVQRPVEPTEGVLPAKVKLPLLHFAWSTLALAVTIFPLVKTTSSVALQTPFVTVQINVTEVPTLSPVTVEVGLLGVVIIAPFVAPGMLQTPVPTEGVLAAKVNEPLLHFAWSTLALAVTGRAFVKTTSSEAVEQPVITVHRSVTVLPAAKPVTVVFGSKGEVIVAPLEAPTNVQVPVA